MSNNLKMAQYLQWQIKSYIMMYQSALFSATLNDP